MADSNLALAAGLLGPGAAGIASTIYGTIQSQKLSQQAKDLLTQMQQQNKTDHAAAQAKDYTQRLDAQLALSNMKNQVDEGINRIRATANITGASDESVNAMTQPLGKAVSDTNAQIAANSENYKEQENTRYQQTRDNLTQQEMQLLQNQANQTAQATAQAGSSAVNLMGTIAKALV